MGNINYVFSHMNLVHYEPEAAWVSEREQYNTVQCTVYKWEYRLLLT